MRQYTNSIGRYTVEVTRHSLVGLVGLLATVLVLASPSSAGATQVRAIAVIPPDTPVLLPTFGQEKTLLFSDETLFSNSVTISRLDVATSSVETLFTVGNGSSTQNITASPNGAFVASHATSACVGRGGMGGGASSVYLWPTVPGAHGTRITLPRGYKTSDTSVVSVSPLGRVTIFTGQNPSCGGASGVLSAAPGATKFTVVAVGDLPGSVIQIPCGCGGTLSDNTLATDVAPTGQVIALCRAFTSRPGTNEHLARLTVVDTTSDLKVYSRTVSYLNEGAPMPVCMASDEGFGAIYTLVKTEAHGQSGRFDGAVVGPDTSRAFSVNGGGIDWFWPVLRPTGTDVLLYDGASGLRFLDVNVVTGRQKKFVLPARLRRAGYTAGTQCGGSISWSPASDTVLFPFCSPGTSGTAYTALTVSSGRWSNALAHPSGVPDGSSIQPCFLASGRTLLSIPRQNGGPRASQLYILSAGGSGWRKVEDHGLLPAIDVETNGLFSSFSSSCGQSDGTVLIRKGGKLYTAQASQLDGSPLVIAP